MATDQLVRQVLDEIEERMEMDEVEERERAINEIGALTQVLQNATPESRLRIMILIYKHLTVH